MMVSLLLAHQKLALSRCLTPLRCLTFKTLEKFMQQCANPFKIHSTLDLTLAIGCLTDCKSYVYGFGEQIRNSGVFSICYNGSLSQN